MLLSQIFFLSHYFTPCPSFQNGQTLGQFFDPLYVMSETFLDIPLDVDVEDQGQSLFDATAMQDMPATANLDTGAESNTDTPRPKHRKQKTVELSESEGSNSQVENDDDEFKMPRALKTWVSPSHDGDKSGDGESEDTFGGFDMPNNQSEHKSQSDAESVACKRSNNEGAALKSFDKAVAQKKEKRAFQKAVQGSRVKVTPNISPFCIWHLPY
jgi:hypothetical protein